MPDRFEDHRGYIQDLLGGPIDGVTEIFTRAGSIRGNHIHRETTQWTYVVYGILKVAWIEDDVLYYKDYGPHSLVTEKAGIPHAWKAMTDCLVLVITRGPRSGANYETDTMRLATPIPFL